MRYYDPRLLLHGVDAKEWTARYGVQPFDYPCSECGRMTTTSIPFVQGTLRGLAAPPCPCGNDRTPYCLVRDPEYGDLFSGVEGPRPRRGKRVKGEMIVINFRSG